MKPRKYCEDIYGRRWQLPHKELCRRCGQPDNTGDCNHRRISTRQAKKLGATFHPDPWGNNSIQFPRLLAEIRAVGLTKKQYEALSESMNLSLEDIEFLFSRAEVVFEFLKGQAPMFHWS